MLNDDVINNADNFHFDNQIKCEELDISFKNLSTTDTAALN